MSTGIIALVFSVIAFFIPSTEILKSSVESTMTGLPPAHNTAMAVAEYVYAGTITSSPGCKPNQRSMRIAPEVQELTHSTLFTPDILPISSSNAFTFGPVVIHPDLSESTTSFITLASMYGGENGIFIFIKFNVYV